MQTRLRLSNLISKYLDVFKPYSANPFYQETLSLLASNIRKISVANSQLSTDPIYYCYVYLDPRYPGNYEYVLPSGKVVRFKYRPFYVGKGKGKRYQDHLHLKLLRPGRNHKNNTIRKLLSLNLPPIIKVTGDRKDAATAFAFEIDLIGGIGRRDLGLGPLANLTDGGDGNCGLVMSAEAKRKISEANKGRPRTLEWRAKTSAAGLRRPRCAQDAASKARRSEGSRLGWIRRKENMKTVNQ